MRRHIGSAGAHHRQRVLQQRADVDACRRGRHQPERRQHGIASADRRVAMEGPRKALLGRDLLKRRAGIGHRDETVPGPVGADRLGDAREEVILHHVRLGGAAGLAGDDKECVGEVDRGLHAADLRGIGRIEHMQFRKAGLLRKRLGEHFRPKARSAHAKHDGIGEVLPLHAVREVLVIRDIGRAGAVQPAQPFVFVGPRPDRFVALPEPSDLAGRAPFLSARFNRLGQAPSDRQLLAVDTGPEHDCALMRDRAVKLIGGIREQVNAVLDQIGRDVVERDTGFFELFEHAPRILDIFLEAVARRAVVAKSVERGRRHGVDGVGADQLLDIKHVAVIFILGAGRGPQ